MRPADGKIGDNRRLAIVARRHVHRCLAAHPGVRAVSGDDKARAQCPAVTEHELRGIRIKRQFPAHCGHDKFYVRRARDFVPQHALQFAVLYDKRQFAQARFVRAEINR